MRRNCYRCLVCDYLYEPECESESAVTKGNSPAGAGMLERIGDSSGITAARGLPTDWKCPECGAGGSSFIFICDDDEAEEDTGCRENRNTRRS